MGPRASKNSTLNTRTAVSPRVWSCPPPSQKDREMVNETFKKAMAEAQGGQAKLKFNLGGKPLTVKGIKLRNAKEMLQNAGIDIKEFNVEKWINKDTKLTAEEKSKWTSKRKKY